MILKNRNIECLNEQELHRLLEDLSSEKRAFQRHSKELLDMLEEDNRLFLRRYIEVQEEMECSNRNRGDLNIFSKNHMEAMDEIRRHRAKNIAELEEAVIEENKKYNRMEEQIREQVTHLREQEE